MALQRKTFDLLPAVFQTDTNKKFLGSTLDNLVNEPRLRDVNGYVGRQFGPTVNPDITYVIEPTANRQNYQLEPSFVIMGNTIVSTYANYNNLLDIIRYHGGITDNAQRLFESEYYVFDPQINLDKLVNYSQYYWLPTGPQEVLISNKTNFLSNIINITYQSANIVTNQTGTTLNPELVLRRGETYTFNIGTGVGNLFIQTEPGSDGIKDYAPGSSTRNIFGVTNNGTNTIIFSVPQGHEQNGIVTSPFIGTVDLALTERFTDIDNRIFTQGSTTFSGQVLYPNDVYVVFVQSSDLSADWTDSTGTVVASDRRRGLWQIKLYTDPSTAQVRTRLNFVRKIAPGTRFTVQRGHLRGREYVVNTQGKFEIADSLTAPLSTLYYQNDTQGICGKIKLVDSVPIAANVTTDILNKVNYTSPDGVKFTSGLKIKFDDTINPPQYRNRTFVIEGVGKAIKLVDWSQLVSPEVIAPQAGVPFDFVNYDQGLYDETFSGSLTPDYIVCDRAGIDLNAWARINRWTHIDVIKQAATLNGVTPTIDQKNAAKRPIIEFKPDLKLFNSGKKFLSPVNKFFEKGFKVVQAGNIQDFNISILFTKTFRYIQQTLNIDIDINDTVVFASDADPNIASKIYSVSAKNLIPRQLTVNDPTLSGTVGIVRQKFAIGTGTKFKTEVQVGDQLFLSDNTYIGKVLRIMGDTELEFTDSVPRISGISGVRNKHSVIELVEITTAQQLNTVVCLSGHNSGHTFVYNTNGVWQRCQRKTQLNQPPLFDIVDKNEISLATAYSASNFAGSKLFSYKVDATVLDSVLGFGLDYTGVGDFIGDINFENNYITDTFMYKPDNINSVKLPVSVGYISRWVDNSMLGNVLTNWNTVGSNTRQYQLFTGIHNGTANLMTIDVPALVSQSSLTDPPNIKVFVNNKFHNRINADLSVAYTANISDSGTKITLSSSTSIKSGDKIDVLIFSDKVSKSGHYQIPVNLEFNPENKQISEISLGQLRNHVIKIGENVQGLIGDILYNNNLRDLEYSTVSGTLLQHSGALPLAMWFLFDRNLTFMDSLDFARKEYSKFKNRFVETMESFKDLNLFDPATAVDRILSKINQVKNNQSPWYHSDMVATGTDHVLRQIKIASGNTFSVSNWHKVNYLASNHAVLIYKNDQLLIRGIDYEFISNSQCPSCVQLTTVVPSDVITIKEYSNTKSSFIPETPTKLALFPKFLPMRYLDNTYRTPTWVIQGHDGSLIPAYNDARDQIILELELRIYNNIKVNYDSQRFNNHRYMPGFFRNTEYSRDEFVRIFSNDFLKWAGQGQVDYISNQAFASNDQFTYNYSRSLGPDQENLPGFWRAIYRYFYDTDRPHTHPWEMLGHSVKPVWWDSHYSWTVTVQRTALILACVSGLVSNPSAPTVIDTVYARSNFNSYVPVNSSGQLISPLSLIVRNYNSETFARSWKVGDGGPVESAWFRSSEYPFALIRAMALMKPARYFSIQADSASYNIDIVLKSLSNFRQFTNSESKTRISFKDTKFNGQSLDSDYVSALGYTNWIFNYCVHQGLEPNTVISSQVAAADIKLSYAMAGFSDKKFLTVQAQQFTPGSLNNSITIPDENYQLHLHRSVPITRITYSAVIVQKTNLGWSVSGYDPKFPFFTIIPNDPASDVYTLSVMDQTVVIYRGFLLQKYTVNYGFEFNTLQQLSDFIIGYQRFLISQGFEFDRYDTELAQALNWELSIQELLTWNVQGWPENSVLILSPVKNDLDIVSTNSVVDSVNSQGWNTGTVYDSRVMGVNFNTFKNTELVFLRDNGRTKISTITGATIAFADLNLIQFEHVLILDNTTVFNDVIYKSEVGNRQYRVKLMGQRTADWDGELTPSGFVLQQKQIDFWKSGKDYRRGQIVSYKDKVYTALEFQPATDTFMFSKWSPLDRPILAGLLPNLAFSSKMFENIYDIDKPPSNETFAKFSTAIIGHRSRPYLENLGMDFTSQSKFYQGFIKDKGTRRSVDVMSRGIFDGELTNITLYEEWAARIGEYGAIDANPELSLLISESVYNTNPINLVFLPAGVKSADKLFVTVNPNHLYFKTLDYDSKIFLNRSNCVVAKQRVEIFGDGILCGKLAQNVFEYGIILTSPGTEFSVFFDTRCDFSVSAPIDEPLIYSIEEVLYNDNPNARSGLEQVLACRFNKTDGRVPLPPDHLLYLALSSRYDVTVTTRSVTGSTSGQLLTGSDGVNATWPDDIEADIVIINHGHNDARSNIPLSVYRSNLSLLRQRLPMHKKIVWLTPTEVDTTVATWALTTSFTLKEYVNVMRDVADEYGDYLASADVIKNWKAYLDIDGVHPTQAGYNALVDKVLAPVVSQVIKDSVKSHHRYYEDDLHSAGYPRVDEVDFRFFDIQNYRSLTIQNSLYTGFKLWVAKDFNKSWQVYCATQYVTNSITAVDLDTANRMRFSMSHVHQLKRNDLVAVRGIDTRVDGFYLVVNTTDKTFSVLADTQQIQNLTNAKLTGIRGQLFDFIKLRFTRYTDLITHKPKRAWNDRYFYSVLALDGADSCLSVYDFARRWAPLYGRTVIDFQAKAHDLLPLYQSNRAFNVVIDNANTIRYGLSRTVDPDSLAMWVDHALSTDRYITTLSLRNEFYNNMTDPIDLTRSLTNNKFFDDYTKDIQGCALFRYRNFGNTAVFSTTTAGDTIRLAVMTQGMTETLIYSIEQPTDQDSLIYVTANNMTWEDLDDNRDLLYVDASDTVCETWSVYRPKLRRLDYDLIKTTEESLSLVYSVVSKDCNAETCWTFQEFAAKYSVIYNKNATVFEQKAQNIIDLFISNRSFSYSQGTKNLVRFGLYSTANTSELARWTNYALVNNFSLSNAQLRAAFFTDLDQNRPSFERHLTAEKSFLSTTTDVKDCVVFADRGETEFSAGNDMTFCVSSVEQNESLVYIIVSVPQNYDSTKIYLSGNVRVYTDKIEPVLSPEYDFFPVRTQDFIVDINSVNNLYLFSQADQKFLTKLDMLDPAKGRILGQAQQDLDYTTSIDPARYRSGVRNITQDMNLPIDELSYWAQEQVGTYWWNMDSCRYIHYEQGELDYRANHWAELFPGSTIEVYEWIESEFLPSLYQANNQDGVPLYVDNRAYSESVYVDPSTNAFVSRYFYWVRGKRSITNSRKRHSVVVLEDMIFRPKNQNIPYMVVYKQNSLGLYNIGQFIKARDSILHVSSKRHMTENIIHSDFVLIQEGSRDIIIPPRIENKIIDSLVARDLADRKVPDPELQGSRKFGLDITPRQTVIKHVRTARENLVKWVNNVFATLPLAYRVFDKNRSISDNFFAKDDFPPKRTTPSQNPNSVYDMVVDTYADINVPIVGVNDSKTILVKQDENNGNYWTLYQKINSGSVIKNIFLRRQAFDVSKLWKFVNWYHPRFSDQTVPDHTVERFSDVYGLNLSDGDVVKVKNTLQTYPTQTQGTVTVQGKFELFEFYSDANRLRMRRVGLESGTLAIDFDFYKIYGYDTSALDTELFDFEPAIEMRYVLQGLRDDVFIEEHRYLYDSMFFYLIDYILSEQKYIDWFMKTSFISVVHSVGGLTQRPTLIKDKQQDFENFMMEAKPYRTKIRQYTLSYTRTDTVGVYLTDFDLPVVRDSNNGKFHVINGDDPVIDATFLNRFQFAAWKENNKFQISGIDLVTSGYGYFSCDKVTVSAPEVVIVRTDSHANTNVHATASVSSITGSIQKIQVDVPGTNYVTTPVVKIAGNGGTSVVDNEFVMYEVISRGTANTDPRSTSLRNSRTQTDIHTNSGTSPGGLVLHVIRFVDGRVMFSEFYQNTSNGVNLFNEDINQVGRDFLVVVAVAGTFDMSSSDLKQSLYRKGASEVILTGYQPGGAYILLGVTGAVQSQGIEIYSGSSANNTMSWATVRFKIQRGRFSAIESHPRLPVLSTAFGYPATPVVNQIYNYGDRSWRFTGTKWVNAKILSPNLVNRPESRRALAVARLSNHQLRKVRTVMRFDRTQYVSTVVDWLPDTGYPINTVLSYQNQAYVTKTNMPAAEKFNFAFVRLIGQDQPSASRNARHGFFDNANDRIMAFYLPTKDNDFIPKILDRLVTGVLGSWTRYNGTTKTIPLDTNLIGDRFGSTAGVSAGNISIIGGSFVDVKASHAPEELVPGIIFDAISIRTVTSQSPFQGHRLFIDMGNARVCTSFTSNTVTTLASDLNYTDTTIVVTDGGRLSEPNPGLLIPGVLEINGERVIYYTKAGNVLGQIRRGVGGTGTPNKHLSGSQVEDVSVPARSSINCDTP